MARCRPCPEALEPRLCLTATPPSLYPGAPLSLADGAPWASSPFAASPIYADLAGNGKQELIVPAAGGKLIAYTTAADGTLVKFREYDSVPEPNSDPAQGNTGAGTQGNVKSTPIVVTMPNGHKAIFAALGRDEAHPGALEDGRVFGWDALTGRVLPGWPQSSGVGFNGERGSRTEVGVTGPLASGDLEGKGQADIVVTSFSAFVTAFRPDGSMIWRYKTDDSINGGAVVGDIDRDGKNEVVFGSDTSLDTSPSHYYNEGGFVNILSSNGSMRSRYAVGEGIWSSPALADLSGNGYLDIVVGTGLRDDLFATASPAVKAAGNVLIALDWQGHPLWTYRTTADNSLSRETYASPAVADLRGDGKLEVIEEDRAGLVHVIQANGKDLPGWEGGRSIFQPGSPPQGDNFSSVIVADVTGGGAPDIIAAGHYALTAFDAGGHALWYLNTPKGANGIPENLQNAPAVGQLDGQGGLELAAVSSLASGTSNPPDMVSIYQLPASPLAPPWPMLRRSAAGVAVAQSVPFETGYVRHAFAALLGRQPTPAELQAGVAALAANQTNNFRFAQALAGSAEASRRTATGLYQQFLGRKPTAAELNSLLRALQKGTAQDAGVTLVTSKAFATRFGSAPTGLVQGLFKAVLGRKPAAAELNGWVARLKARTPLATVARQFLDTDEAIRDLIAPIYRAGLGVSSAAIPADAFQAIAADVRRDRGQAAIFANILGSGGNYAATDPLASWVRSVYRDVEHIAATPAQVASALAALDGGKVTQQQFVAATINSAAGRARYIYEQSVALLGRPTTGIAPQNYARRTDVIVDLAGSQPYYDLHHDDPTSYVLAVYHDVAGLDLPASNSIVQGWVGSIQGGQSRSALPAALVDPADPANSFTHDTKVAVDDLFRYLPDESMGVLRTGNTLASLGQVVNPNPALVTSTVQKIEAGGEEGALVALLTSPQYISKASYYKGYYVSLNIRA